MFGLVDMNSYYVSCEASFNPKIDYFPSVVVGNNDHCVIARNQRAKEIGIKMGQPLFQIRELLAEHNVQICSANFALYGDMSSRFHSIMYEFVEDSEVYSIDEAFIRVDQSYEGIYPSYHSLGEKIRDTILDWLRIPSCVGFAKTKTLAKVANRIAKKTPEMQGVCVLHTKSEVESILADFAIDDLWGIGYQYARMLKQAGFKNALQLRDADINWIRTKMTVNTARLVYELRGYPVRILEDNPLPKRTIIVAPSFGNLIPDISNIKDAMANHLARACEKLRKQDSLAKHLTIFLHTNRNRKTPGNGLDSKQYSASQGITLPFHTNNVSDFLKYGTAALERIYRFGYPYQKVGVVLNDIVPEDYQQGELFTDLPNKKRIELGHTIDRINFKHGRDTVYLAAQTQSKEWGMIQNTLSQRYTTNWGELLVVK